MDWFSRYVLSWSLSTSMAYHFCLEALQEAFQKGKPDTFNTDQIPQFTCEAFTGTLEAEGIRISMDGRGRAMDNIMIERLWRSVKYEEAYLKGYESFADARSGLRQYFRFYNGERLHQSLGYRTPKAIHYGQRSPLPAERPWARVPQPAHRSMSGGRVKAKPSGYYAALTQPPCPCSSGLRPTARGWPLSTSGSGIAEKLLKTINFLSRQWGGL